MPMITVIAEVPRGDPKPAAILQTIKSSLISSFGGTGRHFVLAWETIPAGTYFLFDAEGTEENEWKPVVRIVLSCRNGDAFVREVVTLVRDSLAGALRLPGENITIYVQRIGPGDFLAGNKFI